MKTQIQTTLISLILGIGISAAWLSAVAIGIQSPTQPSLCTVELPPVVVVAHRAAATQTALPSQVTPAQRS
jgi:hypothetical protein